MPTPFYDPNSTTADRLARAAAESVIHPHGNAEAQVDALRVAWRKEAELVFQEALSEWRLASAALDASPAWRFRERSKLREQLEACRNRCRSAAYEVELQYRMRLNTEAQQSEKDRRELQERLYAERPGEHPDPDYARRFTSET